MGDAQNNRDDQELRQRLFDGLRAEIDKRHISNAENLDKGILAYSSAALGFSVTFLKDSMPLATNSVRWPLFSSWGLFTFAVAMVIASYPVSQKVLRIQLDRGERYYIEGDESAYDDRSRWEVAKESITVLSGTSFCAALGLTALYVFLNFIGATSMSTKRVIANDGATVMNMQKVPQPSVPVEKGTTSMPMQRVPSQPAPAPAPGNVNPSSS